MWTWPRQRLWVEKSTISGRRVAQKCAAASTQETCRLFSDSAPYATIFVKEAAVRRLFGWKMTFVDRQILRYEELRLQREVTSSRSERFTKPTAAESMANTSAHNGIPSNGLNDGREPIRAIVAVPATRPRRKSTNIPRLTMPRSKRTAEMTITSSPHAIARTIPIPPLENLD